MATVHAVGRVIVVMSKGKMGLRLVGQTNILVRFKRKDQAPTLKELQSITKYT
jgi:hypothetical protein